MCFVLKYKTGVNLTKEETYFPFQTACRKPCSGVPERGFRHAVGIWAGEEDVIYRDMVTIRYNKKLLLFFEHNHKASVMAHGANS